MRLQVCAPPRRSLLVADATARPNNSGVVDMYQQEGKYRVFARSVAAVVISAAAVATTPIAAAANRAPIISGTPPATAREGLAYFFRPKASDADGDTLTFGISNRPSWAKFSTTTGALTGTPGSGTVGDYPDIRIRVTDGIATARLPLFSIEVQQSSMGSATLSWLAPTTRTDGSLLTNLDGYRIRYGTTIGNYPNLINISNEGLTVAVISNLPPATYYFVISAYDKSGLESAYAGPAFKKIT